MCTPAKRLATAVDVLDLSHKSAIDESSNPADVIVLSEDDDEKATPPTSDTEKENAPYNKNGDDLKSLRISIENELRQEEAALQILQRLRDSQNPNNSRSSSKINAHTSNSSSNTHTNGNSSVQPTASPMLSAQKTPTAVQNPKALQQTVPQSSSPVPAPKITKQAALQSLEQNYATKKTVLRKHLERNLEKIELPRPAAGTGLCEVAFIPSTFTAEFTSLLGLEEVVKTIQDFDPSNPGKTSETKCTFSPFLCVKCGTDFTPVWKREKPGSASVICEACLMEVQCVGLRKEYEESVQQVLQQEVTAEQEIEQEYKDIVSTPAKMDAYIKEQEKKLLVTQQAQQQQLAQQQAAYNQRYGSKSGMSTSVSGLRQSPTIASGNTSVAAVAHQRSRTAAAAVQQAAIAAGLGAATSSTGVTSNSTAAAAAHAATQLALQQYAKALNQATGAAAVSSPAAINATTAALMMAAVANNSQAAAAVAAQQQQQQQQAAAAAAAVAQQQRLAQIFSGLQTQQAFAASLAAGSATSDPANTLNRIQSLLMNNASFFNGGENQIVAARQQLMQYLVLHQQQQQQQAAAAVQAAQQNAAISQLISQFQNNPSTYANLIQLWASGMSGGGAAGGSAANGSKK